MSPRAVVIAGVASGVGKTSITLGLLEALRRRGLTVQAFKVGPDFIDPGFHQIVTGRPSANLDGWMCGRDRVLATVARYGAGADVIVIEGVMGCFDGRDGLSDDGSSAQIAKWLGAPVVLVVDASAQSRSVAAVVLGFERFDPDLRIGGVIVNRVGGDAHAGWVRDAIRESCRTEMLGSIRWSADVKLPERHLGLVSAVEGTLTPERLRRLGDAIEAGIDVGRLLDITRPLSLTREHARPARDASVTIGVARDAAFQFYYDENLSLLADAGARLVFWSPLTARDVPAVDGLYFGGGYPELHARELSDNHSLLEAVREFVDAGRPVYAECGGLMFLAESLEDLDGARYPMVGLLPAGVSMRPRLMTLGYVEVELQSDTLIGSSGARIRGHEFHFSTLDRVPERVPRLYRVLKGDDVTAEGYAVGSALMSYVHLHFASNPEVAVAFVDACLAGRAAARSSHGARL